MAVGEIVEAGKQEPSYFRQLSIPSKLVLLTVPLSVVALVAGGFLVWSVLSSDGTSGISVTEGVAIAIGVVVALAALGTLIAVYITGRSMSRDISGVTAAARTMAHKDLIDLLDTLRSAEPDLASIAPLDLDTTREDEIGDLARSFTDLHGSLIDVAARQMEALRNGVSSIFVTLARRNSSLVDRQLALLDDLESREEDAKTLAGYYQLDHFATRMRRNAESLLVLAGSESPRVWAKPTDMSDVVRAAIGEVDEYQRVELLAVEPARLSGGAVSDVSHLLAELIENALQFSPPSEAVRVTGLFDMDGYQITVSDRGLGVSEARIAELNRILQRPPALGLSVEPTMGMYVIAKLAHRHGVRIELIRGVPGVTARITLPRDHLEVPERPEVKHWEVERGDREPRGPEPHELTDAATRQYVMKRSQQTGVLISDDGPDELIDLTSPEMTGPETLPVRRPGNTFAADVPAPATGPGESATGIRSALSAYEDGRRAAARSDEVEEAS